MNGTPERRIEIFAPFSAALDLAKRILFQPFDITKWLVLGFAAFLSHLAGGGGVNFNFRSPLGGQKDWSVRSTTHDVLHSNVLSHMSPWLILGIGFGVLLALGIGVACLWVGSRGKFIFTDCVVRNRAAIAEPWHEFRREGNSYFVFALIIGLGMLLVFALAGMPLWLPLVLHGAAPHNGALVFGLILLACVAGVLALVFSILKHLMVPIMYRRRCGAVEGVKAALALILAEPGPVILYILFLLVLWVAFALVACLTSCVTCCVAALPYVGTVLLLPGYVFFLSYLLLFLRQFGPEYDVWTSPRAAGTTTTWSPGVTQPDAATPAASNPSTLTGAESSIRPNDELPPPPPPYQA